eukprot:6735159-Prymnesium_polylepis.1
MSSRVVCLHGRTETRCIEFLMHVTRVRRLWFVALGVAALVSSRRKTKSPGRRFTLPPPPPRHDPAGKVLTPRDRGRDYPPWGATVPTRYYLGGGPGGPLGRSRHHWLAGAASALQPPHLIL